MFDGFQTLLIGSTFRERKQMNDEWKQMIQKAEQNESLREKLKDNFVHLELSKMATADPDFSYYCVYWSAQQNVCYWEALDSWYAKDQENKKLYGEDKWRQMFEDEAKSFWKSNHYSKAKKREEIRDAKDEYKKSQVEEIRKKLITPKLEKEKIKKDRQSWEKEFTEWQIIKDSYDLKKLSDILNISPPLKLLDMSVLPLEAKKVIYGIFNFKYVRFWASEKKIINYKFHFDKFNNLENYKSKSVDEEYAELTAYQTLHDFAPTSDSSQSGQDLENKITSLEAEMFKLNKNLEKIEDQLEKLISLKK